MDNKICTNCKIAKSTDSFGKNPRCKNGIKTWCKECEAKQTQKSRNKNITVFREKHRLYMKNYRSNNIEKFRPIEKERSRIERTNHPERRIYYGNKSRAKRLGIPFTINKEDIVIPEYCPILGIKLERSVGKISDASPSLDKIIPELGYVPGNIAVISSKANRMKSDGSIKDFEAIINYIKQYRN